jgi:large subunit ribosomal protein L10
VAVDTCQRQQHTSPDAHQHSRATVRPDKAAAVAELAEAFRGASAAVLTEYRGLTVKQISDLRRALGADTTYSVVKNTLTRLAAPTPGVDGVGDLLTGPDRRRVRQWRPRRGRQGPCATSPKANPVLFVKGGVMDGKALTADEVRKLADLESREVLLGKLAGGMLATLSKAVYVLNAPLAQAARLAGALQQKATEDPLGHRRCGTPAAQLTEPAEPVEAQSQPAADHGARGLRRRGRRRGGRIRTSRPTWPTWTLLPSSRPATPLPDPAAPREPRPTCATPPEDAAQAPDHRRTARHGEAQHRRAP